MGRVGAAGDGGRVVPRWADARARRGIATSPRLRSSPPHPLATPSTHNRTSTWDQCVTGFCEVGSSDALERVNSSRASVLSWAEYRSRHACRRVQKATTGAWASVLDQADSILDHLEGPQDSAVPQDSENSAKTIVAANCCRPVRESCASIVTRWQQCGVAFFFRAVQSCWL